MKKCPACGTWHSDSTESCDCGHTFVVTHPKPSAQEGALPAETPEVVRGQATPWYLHLGLLMPLCLLAARPRLSFIGIVIGVLVWVRHGLRGILALAPLMVLPAAGFILWAAAGPAAVRNLANMDDTTATIAGFAILIGLVVTGVFLEHKLGGRLKPQEHQGESPHTP